MADVFTKNKRSEIMSRIRSKNTGIEKVIFRFLRKKGIYFRAHYDRVHGKPDIAIPSKKIAVFINGDFWHGYRFPAWRDKIPKKYWREKISGNIMRDRRNIAWLKRHGWRVMRVWGHEITEYPIVACKKVSYFLRSNH